MSKLDTTNELLASCPYRNDVKLWGRLKQAEKDLLDRLRNGAWARQWDIDRLRALVKRLGKVT